MGDGSMRSELGLADSPSPIHFQSNHPGEDKVKLVIESHAYHSFRLNIEYFLRHICRIEYLS